MIRVVNFFAKAKNHKIFIKPVQNRGVTCFINFPNAQNHKSLLSKRLKNQTTYLTNHFSAILSSLEEVFDSLNHSSLIGSMTISWRRWEPTDHHDPSAPDSPLVEAIDYALENEAHHVSFRGIWKSWLSCFPDSFVLATLTQSRLEAQQLRLWFGEPNGFSPAYVDSMGHNLIVNISGKKRRLHRLVENVILPPVDADFEAKPDEHEGVMVWRRVED